MYRDGRLAFILIVTTVLGIVAWTWTRPIRDLQNQAIRDDATITMPDGRSYALSGNPDSYTWIRAARNVLTTGDPCDTRVHGVCRDTKFLGPSGNQWIYAENLHVYAIAWFVRAARWVYAPIPLTAAAKGVALVAVLIGTLAGCIFGWRLAGPSGAMIVGLTASLSPWLIVRSIEGDNDCWQFTLPIIAALALTESFRARSERASVAAAAGAAIAMSLFAWAWHGWVFYNTIWILAIICSGAIEVFRDRTAARRCLVRFAVFLAITSVGGLWLGGSPPFMMPVSPAPQASTLHWPQAFTMVGELAETSPADVAATMHGWTGVVLALAGIAAGFRQAFRADRFGPIFLIAGWFAAVFILGSMRLRFLELTIPPAALAWALLAGAVVEKLRGRHLALTAFAIAVAALQFPVVAAGTDAVETNSAGLNRAWWDTFDHLHAISSPNAIIHMWWDWGYAAQYVADRRVSTDGGTLETHAAYWVGRALLAPERESIGTFRMLSCGGDSLPLPEGESGAFAFARKVAHEDVGAYRLLKTLFVMDRSEAQAELLRRGADASLAVGLLETTHCAPPESWVVLSNVNALAPAWEVMGAQDLETGATPPTPRFGNVDGWRCTKRPSELVCPSPDGRAAVRVSTDGTATVENDRGDPLIPELVVNVDENGIRSETVNANPSAPGLAAVIDRHHMLAWQMPPILARSTFVSLMFLDGWGSRYFEPGIWRQSFRPSLIEKVGAFRIRWPGATS